MTAFSVCLDEEVNLAAKHATTFPREAVAFRLDKVSSPDLVR